MGVLEVEGVRENMASTVLSKDDGPLSPRTHFTVEATHTRLTHDAVELRLLWVLATDVTDLGLGIVGDETRLFGRNRTTSLDGGRERERTVP